MMLPANGGYYISVIIVMTEEYIENWVGGEQGREDSDLKK